MELITIITPTYNRANELKKLYISLKKQTSNNFLWMIIDDGSSDCTFNEIQKFEKIKIEYIKKKNGGKHTALNKAFNNLKTDLAIIVDSDDKLTKDAIKTIENDWKKNKKNKNICGLVYKKISYNGIPVSSNFRENSFEDNYNNYIINQGIKGDKAEVFMSKVLKKYRYPEFKNEKFIGEGVLWSKIARHYNMIFINKCIYVCDYLENGLTKSGRTLRIKNPLGGMFHAEEYLDKIYTFKIREKNALLYLSYAMFAKKKILKLCLNNKYKILLLINIIPSYIIYMIWKKRYL